MFSKFSWIITLLAALVLILAGCNERPNIDMTERCDICRNPVDSCVCTPPDNAIPLGVFNWDGGAHSNENQQGWSASADRSIEDIITAKTLVLFFENPPKFDFSIVFQSVDLGWGSISIEYDNVRSRFKNIAGVTAGKDNKIFTIDIPKVLGNNYANFSNPATSFANIIIAYFGRGSEYNDYLSDLGDMSASYLIPADLTACPVCGELICICNLCKVCKNNPCTCVPDNAVTLGEFDWFSDNEYKNNMKGWNFDEPRTTLFKYADSLVIRIENNAIAGGVRLMFNGDGFNSNQIQKFIIYTPEGIVTADKGVTLSSDKKEITVKLSELLDNEIQRDDNGNLTASTGKHYSKLTDCSEWSSLVLMYWGMSGQNLNSFGKVFAFLVVNADIPVTDTNIVLAAPAGGGTPVTLIDTAQYTGIVEWTPEIIGGVFAADKIYTASISLKAKKPYTFDGVTGFSVNGITANFNAAALTVEYTFPVPGECPICGKDPCECIFESGDLQVIDAFTVIHHNPSVEADGDGAAFSNTDGSVTFDGSIGWGRLSYEFPVSESITGFDSFQIDLNITRHDTSQPAKLIVKQYKGETTASDKTGESYPNAGFHDTSTVVFNRTYDFSLSVFTLGGISFEYNHGDYTSNSNSESFTVKINKVTFTKVDDSVPAEINVTLPGDSAVNAAPFVNSDLGKFYFIPLTGVPGSFDYRKYSRISMDVEFLNNGTPVTINGYGMAMVKVVSNTAVLPDTPEYSYSALIGNWYNLMSGTQSTTGINNLASAPGGLLIITQNISGYTHIRVANIRFLLQ